MATTTEQLGRLLAGRYRLEGALGTGASARVYLAYDTRLARRVAVKVLHPSLAADEGFLRRFRAEAQLVASLNHPNVLSVYDWGEEPDGPFLVLEYLAGGSLRDLFDRRGPLSPAHAVAIGREASEGLAYAHRRGLVHRDVKPGNLLFDEDGHVRVADFGLARALAEAASTEPAGAVLGTARYASPEQAEGRRLDDRSDVYSLALVLYEAVVGRVPFSADTTLATLMARVGATLPPARELAGLYPVLAQATIADPQVRLDASGLAIELGLLQHALGAPEPLLFPGGPPPGTPPAGGGQGHGPATFYDQSAEDAPAAPAPPASDATLIEPLAARPHRRPARGAARRARRGVQLAAGAAVVLAAAALAARMLVFDHHVPRLSGETLSAAGTAADRSGLHLLVAGRRFSASVAAGEVLAQSPGPGHLVRAGTAVEVEVSKGPAPVLLVSERGRPAGAARALLARLGLVAVPVPTFSASVPRGDVVATAPSSGRVPGHSRVVVYVSKGPAPVTIPALAGDSWSAARAALGLLGLRPQEALAYSSSVPAGEVVATDPAIGTKGVAVHSPVTVTISRGPQLVVVPNVYGDAIDTAVSVLENAGLSVTEETGPPFATTAETTSPAAGTSVAIGSAVTLYVS